MHAQNHAGDWRVCVSLGASFHVRRYKTHALSDTAKKDYSSAERYYYQAVDVFPEGVWACFLLLLLGA